LLNKVQTWGRYADLPLAARAMLYWQDLVKQCGEPRVANWLANTISESRPRGFYVLQKIGD